MTKEKIDEMSKNLESIGLIEINPKNSEEAKLTKKGLEEVVRWKDGHKEMDFLLFLYEGIKEKIDELLKEKPKKSFLGFFKRE